MGNRSMTKEIRMYNGGKTVSPVSGAEEIEQMHVENEIGAFSYITYKIKLNMS